MSDERSKRPFPQEPESRAIAISKLAGGYLPPGRRRCYCNHVWRPAGLSAFHPLGIGIQNALTENA